MLKGIKIRLYPNKEQEVYISKLLGSYRFVYNKCLDLKKSVYLESKKNLGLKELGIYFHNDLTKSDEFSFLNEHNTKVLKQSIMNLLESYKRFFVNGTGFPKFKSKKDNLHSCRFPIDAISKNNDFNSGRITLTKQLKNIKFRCSDKYKQILNSSIIKSATLTKTKSGKYFLSILVETEDNKVLPETNSVVGIDLGVKDFIVTSDGKKYDNLKLKRNNHKKLKRLHKNLSRKQKGSKNKDKARIKLAKYHEKLNNIKQNYLHKVSNELLNDNQIIVMENLNVSGMMKNHNLANSIQELSLYNFKNILKYKADWHNKTIIEVDRFFPSSKLCSVCSYKNNDLKLNDREWKCKNCSTHHNRDLNAAINIKKQGMKFLNNIIPIRDGKLKLVEISSVDDRQAKPDLKSILSMKQEY